MEVKEVQENEEQGLINTVFNIKVGLGIDDFFINCVSDNNQLSSSPAMVQELMVKIRICSLIVVNVLMSSVWTH